MTNWDTMLCSRTDGWKPWLSPNLDIWICYLIFAEFAQFFFGSNQMNVDISCMQTQNRFFSCKTVPTNPARTNKVASKPFRFRIVAETARVVWYAFPVELFVEHRKIYPCWLSLYNCLSYFAGSWLTTPESKMQVIHVSCDHVTLWICFWSAWSDMIAG